MFCTNASLNLADRRKLRRHVDENERNWRSLMDCRCRWKDAFNVADDCNVLVDADDA